MGRPAPRRSPPSGSVLLWDRRRREATQALAAQVPAAARAGSGTNAVIGLPISEQNQRVEIRPDVRVARAELGSAGA